MDFEALYKFRFRDVDLNARYLVWESISEYIYEIGGKPAVVLDPACGLGEFINSVPAPEKWALDLGINGSQLNENVKFRQTSFTECDLPKDYFDLIFMSNVLEHLPTQEVINEFLIKAKHLLRSTGCLVIMGPNFKYCSKEYFDCADHVLALTHVSIEEHLATAGYRVSRVCPKFLPYSFRSRLPANPLLTRTYLRLPFLWRLLGKQFLIVAQPTH